jgi:hypothetical protein
MVVYVTFQTSDGNIVHYFLDNKMQIDYIIAKHKKKYKLLNREERRTMRVLRHYINAVEYHKYHPTIVDFKIVRDIHNGLLCYLAFRKPTFSVQQIHGTTLELSTFTTTQIQTVTFQSSG